MVRETVVEADTVEEAIAHACIELGVEIDKADYEILQPPEKKLFGLFKGKKARVRVFVESMSPAERACEYIEDVIENMGVKEPKATVISQDDEHIVINLQGGNIRYVIGHRGDILDSLEYLVCLVANSDSEKYIRISLDVGDFRDNREVSLKALAKKMSIKALKKHDSIRLEPMNAYERKIIHNSANEVEGIVTWSIGKEPKKRVVIADETCERAIAHKKYMERMQMVNSNADPLDDIIEE